MRATVTDLDLAPPVLAAPPPATLLTIGRSAVNINPVTGLACDYLNHFNEAIMLLELLAGAPEHRDDLAGWRPRSYRDHFAASRFADRETVLHAYESSDPGLRRRLDDIVEAMSDVLKATCEELLRDHQPLAVAMLAKRAAGLLRPLVARAGAVINGTDGTDDIESRGAAVTARSHVNAPIDR